MIKEIAYTVNRRGRMLLCGGVMIVQGLRRNHWGAVWASECLDDGDIADGIEFMEGYFS